MPANLFNIVGLTDEQVLLAARQYGKNRLSYKKDNEFLNAIKRIASDPMIILLLVASFIYFVNGQVGDGFFLVAAIVFIASISFYQYRRSKNALDKLRDFSQPYCKV